MKSIPSLIIVTDRGHLIAYRIDDSGQIHRIDSTTFSEGNDRISDIVTDQAGAFPTTAGVATASFESLPLVAELEMRCFRQIATKIREIIDREHASTWAFATPSEINGAILDGLGDSYLKRLAINLKRDIVNVPQIEIKERFEKAKLDA